MKAQKKYEDVPMFDIAPSMIGGVEKKQYTKSVAFGSCPRCLHGRTGLVMQGAHLVWRLHDYRTYSGAPLPCQAGGIPVCEMPGRHTPGQDEPRCSCMPEELPSS